MAMVSSGSLKVAAAPVTVAAPAKVYTLAELRQKPPELDKDKLETYLTPEQFKQIFKIEKTGFAKLPAWKQEEMKKKLGLY